MENAVYYSTASKEGEKSQEDHAGYVAGAIANGAQTSAYAIGKHTFIANTGILFLGCEVHGDGKVPGSFHEILTKLEPKEVKFAALFSVILSGETSAMAQAKAILEPKGIKICDEEFICKGSSFLHNKGCPTQQDLEKAREFGAMIKSKYKIV